MEGHEAQEHTVGIIQVVFPVGEMQAVDLPVGEAAGGQAPAGMAQFQATTAEPPWLPAATCLSG